MFVLVLDRSYEMYNVRRRRRLVLSGKINAPHQAPHIVEWTRFWNFGAFELWLNQSLYSEDEAREMCKPHASKWFCFRTSWYIFLSFSKQLSYGRSHMHLPFTSSYIRAIRNSRQGTWHNIKGSSRHDFGFWVSFFFDCIFHKSFQFCDWENYNLQYLEVNWFRTKLYPTQPCLRQQFTQITHQHLSTRNTIRCVLTTTRHRELKWRRRWWNW